MADQLDPNDPANALLGNAFKSAPWVTTVIGVIALLGPTVIGLLPPNGAVAAVVGSVVLLATFVWQRLGAKQVAIKGAADVAVARAVNPPTSGDPSA
jgi:hypothetical protein